MDWGETSKGNLVISSHYKCFVIKSLKDHLSGDYNQCPRIFAAGKIFAKRAFAQAYQKVLMISLTQQY